MEKKFQNHPVFKQLERYERFYENLSISIMQIIPLGVTGVINFNSYIYSSMQGTLESIREVLYRGRINDAFALLRKFYDAVIINVYVMLFLEDQFTVNKFFVDGIDNWLRGKKQLPEIKKMIKYISNSSKVAAITKLLNLDDRYQKLRNRCNSNTHYNFYLNALLNDNQIYLEDRLTYLQQFAEDLENIIIFHFSYLFSINDYYMMSSEYIDSLEMELQPKEDSQYNVAPFIQEFFDNVIKKNRLDLANEIKYKTTMRLS